MVLAVVVAVLVVLGLLAVMFVGSREPQAPVVADPADLQPPSVPEPIGAPAEDAVPVRVELEDRRYQWARVLDTDGNRLLQGDRSGVEGDLEPGNYWLGVKRVGLGAATVEIEITEAGLSLRCVAGEEGRTNCFDSIAGDEATEEGPVVVLQP